MIRILARAYFGDAAATALARGWTFAPGARVVVVENCT